jgi:type II secretory pathway predicted ATPase ExeA
MNEKDIPVSQVGDTSTPVRSAEVAVEGQSVERMFLQHYGLNEQPFGVTPDRRFLYLGPKHRQALTALTYGTELNRGFLTLIAKPGMGKTSLLFQFLGAVRNNARTAFLFQTMSDARDLMRYLLADLGLDGTGKDLPEMHAILNQILMEEMRAGRRLILVIDEAQNLDEKGLEFVRLLSNFETPWMKLMQIVMAGQPQLAEKLAQPSMAQLRQRVSFSIRIEPLTREEIDAYIDHRLWVAGYNGPPLFTVGARMLLAEHSEGIPRNISNLSFCAMSLAWATKAKTIDREIMRDVIADIDPDSPNEKPNEKGNEKTDASLKSADEPKQQVIPIGARPAVLTVAEPPARNWLTKVGLVSAALLALGWTGIHFNFEQRIGYSLHDIAAAVKSFVVSASSPAELAPADEKNPHVPPQSRVDLTAPSRGSN